MAPAAGAIDQEWLTRLRRRLDAAPLRPRAALAIAPAGGEATIVGSIEPALAARLARAPLPLREAGAAWRIEPPASLAVDPVLAAVAHWLHSNGEAAAWRGERLPVEGADGRVVGSIERAAVRPLGIATHAVHLVACDSRGSVWVQQRAFDKATDPGLWDTAVGGLVAAGESGAATLVRESWEEAGLDAADLAGASSLGRLTVRRPVAEGYQVEHIEMFEVSLREGVVPRNQDGEVERFECLSVPALVERLHSDAFTPEAALILVTWLEWARRPHQS